MITERKKIDIISEARTHTHAHTHVRTYARTHVHTHTRTHARTHARLYIQTKNWNDSDDHSETLRYIFVHVIKCLSGVEPSALGIKFLDAWVGRKEYKTIRSRCELKTNKRPKTTRIGFNLYEMCTL